MVGPLYTLGRGVVGWKRYQKGAFMEPTCEPSEIDSGTFFYSKPKERRLNFHWEAYFGVNCYGNRSLSREIIGSKGKETLEREKRGEGKK